MVINISNALAVKRGESASIRPRLSLLFGMVITMAIQFF